MAKVKSEFTNYMVGIKNNINDNNCFINVCLQTILHFKDLRYILLDDEKFKIFNNSPNIMKQFILILSSYNVISENTPNNNKKIIDPQNFRMAVAEYFKKKGEYQLYSKGDPIELLDNLLKFIHSYMLTGFNKIEYFDEKCNPPCGIHNLFFINISEHLFCNKCNFDNKQNYDSNYFIHLINVSNILEIVNKNKLTFYDFYGKLIHCSKINEIQECYKCKNYSLNKEFICDSLGKFIIINLTWENHFISLETICMISCMITNHFLPQDLFSCDIKGMNYKFLGMILLYTNHYVSIFFEKAKGYILYDDSHIKNFQTWKEVIKEIITNRFIPICIFYENNIRNYSKWNLDEVIYKRLLSHCKKKDKEKKNEKFVNLNDGEWICDQCNQINSPYQINCVKCNFKNSIIELLVQQELRIQNNNSNNFDNNNNKNNINNNNYYNNNNIENIQSINNNEFWICQFCQSKNFKQKCTMCGRRNNNSKKESNEKKDIISIKYWTCTSCNFSFNPLNNKNCLKCNKIKSI